MSRFIVAAVVACLALAGAAPAQDVQLAWALKKGDKRLLTMEGKNKSATSTVNPGGQRQDEEENSTQQSTMLLEVVEVTDAGNIKLVGQFQSMRTENVSKMQTMVFGATRGADGQVQVTAKVESQNPAMKPEEIKPLLEAIARNMLELKSQFEINRRGQVVSVQVSGDPFKDLPENTLVARMAGKMLRKLLSPDELSKALASQAFTQLPANAVKIGDAWDVQRGMAMMGLQMDGKGMATLKGMDNGTAAISESLKYNVNTDGFCKLMKSVFEDMFKEMNLPATVDMEMQAGEVSVLSTATFDPKTCNGVTSYDEMKVPMNGAITITVQGQPQKITMQINVTSSSKATLSTP